MIVKATEDMWVLSAERVLTIPQVKAASRELAPQMQALATRLGLKVAGPWTFISRDLPRDGKTPFRWRICLPIEKAACGAVEGFEICHLEPIMVASADHHGSMRTLFSQGYGPLVAAIEASRHAFSGESREIYHHWSGQGGRYQRIEIQFGLAY